MEPSNQIQSSEDHLNKESQNCDDHLNKESQNCDDHLNKESQNSEIQDIRMISPPANQDREQERNERNQDREDREKERNNRNQDREQERNNRNQDSEYRNRGGRGNYSRSSQPVHHRQHASANPVPYNGSHWFQATYAGGWDYPAAHFMHPYGFPAARPLPPQHESSARNHRNPHHRAQNQSRPANPNVAGWDNGAPCGNPNVAGCDYRTPYANPNVGGCDYATLSPMISPVNQGYLPPMAYYIPPNFGQQNMYNPGRPSQSPPLPPTYRGNHFPTKALYWRIVNQVNYYFGDENLKGDYFLKSHMDADGWVPISLIATFHRMKQLTDDIEFMLFALKGSSIVEVSGDKIRRRR